MEPYEGFTNTPEELRPTENDMTEPAALAGFGLRITSELNQKWKE